MGQEPQPAINRFNAKVRRFGHPEGCWQWTAYIDNTTGYGKFMWNETVSSAHRFAYGHFVGAIPDGLQIDHLCRNRWCVNPKHLEPVTLVENLLRGDTTHWGRWQREKTHCPRGHGYTTDNVWTSSSGSRYCRSCNRERMAERRARIRASA